MPIRILPPEVVDQIAAGEVVERPSHLVKELVENALDAGASRVTVDYAEGGRRVKVVDDGGGLSREELPLALERFATSKLRAADDLWSLATFGFRGEALASLAAVSRLTMTSRQPGDETAWQIISEFGRRHETHAVGGAPGTTVLIEELFANIPARLKFLKSESAEHGQIRSTLKAMALARPDVEFRVHENGRLLFYYPAVASRRERAEQVLEIQPLFEGEAERDGVRARAVFAAPSTIAKTSRQIWLFAQGRWIQDRGLQAAVTEAYRNLLMHGEFPIAAVWVECEPGTIDVNIHPTKSQVKFRDPSLAFRAVQGSLRTRLEEAPWQPRREDGVENAVLAFSEASAAAAAAVAPGVAPMNFAPVTESLRFSDPAFGVTNLRRKDEPLVVRERGAMPSSLTTPHAAETATPAEAAVGPWSSLQVLGQAQLTYILAQNENSLVLVDQHAAHERVAFERLMAAWRGGRIYVQEFLFPFAVDLSPEQVDALGGITAELAKLGITLEVFGPGTVGVTAGPTLLKDSVYGTMLERTANEILERGGSFRFEKVVGDLCATMACHSVVRAGQTLSVEQMRQLLRDMDEFPLSGFCPHGRPVSVEMSFTSLEKQFGRIP